ncbi:hypothetical protein [Aeromonas veronii]|uniref:hypothetical protein n=1 Tax=Aeromonas veronii TaxID=654 RepID=UPI00040A0A1C
MRLAWLLLSFPSLAFAIAGCPVGVQLGNVTIATRLPVCLKFDSSQLGGCEVNCKGVCVELPLANTKGPVETTGTACNYTDNGSGNGDSDGSGHTPGEGNNSENGGLPKDWDFFNPVVGDATGTSVSASIAKLNKNLGKHIGAFSEGTERIYSRVNQISGDTTRIVNATETAERLLKDIAEYNRAAQSTMEGSNLSLSRIEQGIQESNVHLKKIADKGGDSGSGGSAGREFDQDRLFGVLDAMRWGVFNSMDQKLNSMQNPLNSIAGAMGSNGMAGNINAMRGTLEQISAKMGSSGGSTGGGSSGGGAGDPSMQQMLEGMKFMAKDLRDIRNSVAGDGTGSGSGSGSGDSGIDYSKMPGSGNHPLTVGAAHYNSACTGGDCFFDIAAIQKKLDDANKAISDKHKSIGDEVKDMFDFQLSGSAGIMECFDFFTYGGKDYRVCPPAKEYWDIIAALMMFIFYFIAFAIVFKR